MDSGDTSIARPTYEKPEVNSEEVFETLALTCTKADAQCAAPVGFAVVQS